MVFFVKNAIKSRQTDRTWLSENPVSSVTKIWTSLSYCDHVVQEGVRSRFVATRVVLMHFVLAIVNVTGCGVQPEPDPVHAVRNENVDVDSEVDEMSWMTIERQFQDFSFLPQGALSHWHYQR